MPNLPQASHSASMIYLLQTDSLLGAIGEFFKIFFRYFLAAHAQRRNSETLHFRGQKCALRKQARQVSALCGRPPCRFKFAAGSDFQIASEASLTRIQKKLNSDLHARMLCR